MPPGNWLPEIQQYAARSYSPDSLPGHSGLFRVYPRGRKLRPHPDRPDLTMDAQIKAEDLRIFFAKEYLAPRITAFRDPYGGIRRGTTHGEFVAERFGTPEFFEAMAPKPQRGILGIDWLTPGIIVIGLLSFGAGLAGGAAAGAAAAEAGAEVAAEALLAEEAAAISAGEAAGAGAAVAAGVDDALEAAEDVVDAASDSIVGGVLDSVGQLRETLAPIIDTISGAVKQIRDVVVAINDGIIKPVVTPILETVKIIKGLTETIERLQKEGILGILKIPQAITDAFVSLDATFQRAVQMLGAQYLDALERKLIPGLVVAGAAPLGQLNAIVKAAWPEPGPDWVLPRIVEVTEQIDITAYKADIAATVAALNSAEGWVGQLGAMLITILSAVPALLMLRLPAETVWRDEIMAATGVMRFDVGTALDLHSKGILTREQAVADIRATGLSESRAEALLAGLRRIPQDAQAVDWFYRGLISEDGLRAILDTNNWEVEDQQRVIDAARKLPGLGDALTGWHQSVIGEADLDKLLAAQGYSAEWAAMLKLISFTPRSVPDIVRQLARMALLANSGLMAPDERIPPEDVMRAGREAGLSTEAIGAEWSNHWQILTPSQAVDGYFRGWFTEDQIAHYLDAWSIPRSFQRNYIDLQRPRIPFRTTATLMAQGLISESDGFSILQSHGFTQADANLMVQIERRSVKGPSVAAADSFAGLTQSTILQLYDAGTLERDTARGLLAEVGMGADAADSVLTLADVKEATQTRATEIDLIVAAATGGTISAEDAVAEMSSLGASAQEMNKALAKITRGLKSGTKLPSEDKLLQMWRKGILSREAAADALGVLGYNAGWRELLLTLEASRGSGP